jgi:hypothetical protein
MSSISLDISIHRFERFSRFRLEVEKQFGRMAGLDGLSYN